MTKPSPTSHLPDLERELATLPDTMEGLWGCKVVADKKIKYWRAYAKGVDQKLVRRMKEMQEEMEREVEKIREEKAREVEKIREEKAREVEDLRERLRMAERRSRIADVYDFLKS